MFEELQTTKPGTGQHGGNVMPVSISATVSIEIFQNQETHVFDVFSIKFVICWSPVRVSAL